VSAIGTGTTKTWNVKNYTGVPQVPTDEGTSGQVLTSQGTGVQPIWSSPGGGTTHEMLSATHTDTTVTAKARGGLLVVDSTPKWVQLALGTGGTFLRSDGTDALWAAITNSDLPAHDHSTSSQGGDALNPSDANFTIHDQAVTTKKLAFQCSGISSLTTRTITAQNADLTMAGIDVAQTFTKTQTFDVTGSPASVAIIARMDPAQSANLFEMYDSGSNLATWVDSNGQFLTGTVKLVSGANAGSLVPAALTLNRTWTFPNVTGTVAVLGGTQTFSATTLNTGCKIVCNTGAGVTFQDSTTTTEQMRFDLTQIAASTTRNITWTNADGVVATDSNVLLSDDGDVLSYEGDILLDMAA